MTQFIFSLPFCLFFAAASPFSIRLAAAEPPAKPAVPINVLLLGDRAGIIGPRRSTK